MTRASNDLMQLCLVAQPDIKTVPTTQPRYLRMLSESLDETRTYTAAKELSRDAQTTSSTLTDIKCGGDLKFNLSFGEYDPLIAAVLMSTWADYGTNGVGTSFTADFAATTITASAAPTGNSALTTLKKGQWFKLNAPTNTNDGKFLRISSTVAPTATVITLDPSTPLVTGLVVANVTLAASRTSNKTTPRAFCVERQLTDVVQFMTYMGQYPTKLGLDFKSGAITEGTINFLGKNLLPISGATALTGTPRDSLILDVHNALTGMGNLWEGGIPLVNTDIKSLKVDFNNNLRPQTAIGTVGLVGVGVGNMDIKGTMEVYFSEATPALYNKFINGVYTSIVFSTQDSAGNGYVITIPRAKLSAGKPNNSGQNTDFMMTFEFEGHGDKTQVDPALGRAIYIDRLGVAVLP